MCFADATSLLYVVPRTSIITQYSHQSLAYNIASIRSEWLMYSYHFHVTSVLQALSFACSAKYIATMADKADQVMAVHCVPAAQAVLRDNPQVFFIIVYALFSPPCIHYSLFPTTPFAVLSLGVSTSLSGSCSLVLPLFYILILAYHFSYCSI